MKVVTRYRASADCHNYAVQMDDLSMIWRFPSGVRPTECFFTFRPVNGSASPYYGPPPSDTLRTLIKAGAPWYAVLDKLLEEYPAWEEHFAGVTAHCALGANSPSGQG